MGKPFTHVNAHIKPTYVGGQQWTPSDTQKGENIDIKENPAPLWTVRDGILVPATGIEPVPQPSEGCMISISPRGAGLHYS